MLRFLFAPIEMDPEEKEKLLKEIERLKEEISSMRSSSLLGDQQPKDIVRKSLKHLCSTCPASRSPPFRGPFDI